MRTAVSIRTWAKLGPIAFGLAQLATACGGDDGSGDGGGASQAGGSCTTPDACWEVSNPPAYDVATECVFSQGTWSKAACDPAGYVRKCTQVTPVSVNDGPEMDVTYVYYFPATSNFACLGTEEPL